MYVCVSVCIPQEFRYPWRSEEGVRLPGASHVGAGCSELCSLEEQEHS